MIRIFNLVDSFILKIKWYCFNYIVLITERPKTNPYPNRKPNPERWPWTWTLAQVFLVLRHLKILISGKRCIVLWTLMFNIIINSTPRSGAYLPLGHELGVMVLIFAFSDSWGLFTQNIFPGKIVWRTLPWGSMFLYSFWK